MSDKNVDSDIKAKRGISREVMLLSIIAVILVGTVLYLAKTVIIPLIFAYLLSYLVSPLLSALKKAKVPASLSVLFIVIMLLAGAYLFGVFLYQRVGDVAVELPRYHAKLLELSSSVNDRWDVMDRLNLDDSSFREINWLKLVGSKVVTFSGSFVGFMGTTVFVLIFLVFMLLEQGHLNTKLFHALPDDQAKKISNAVDSITSQIRRYLQIKVLVSFITGVMVWFALTMLKVDFAATWGMVAFFLNFIPSIGSIIASVPPIIVAFVDKYPSPLPIVLTVVCILLIQIIMGNIVEPRLQGQGLNLSPVIILISLVFWGWLWGIPGMLLSVPIASSIKIACENIDPLKPVGIFMSGGRFLESKEPAS